MKQIYFIIVVLAGGILLGGCGKGSGDRGELTGVPQRSFRAEVPYGMVYIPSGSFMMGQTDQDVTFASIAQTKQVTVPAFFMDETEVSNSKYRQFVNWVRDSIAITNYLNDPKYFITPKGAGANTNGKKYINWAYVKHYPISFNPRRKGNAANVAKLQGMFYQGLDRVFDRNELDVRLLNTIILSSRFAMQQITRTIRQKDVRISSSAILLQFTLIL